MQESKCQPGDQLNEGDDLREAKVIGIRDRLPDMDGRLIEGGGRVRRGGRREASSLPLVSIFTVCRNAEATILRAINSVKSQTYPNIEYIIVDGQSTDGTLEIISKNRKHIEYFASQKDSGIYNAMNTALSLCHGDYIALINADDYLFDNFIEKSIDALKNDDADISYCDYLSESGRVYCHDFNDGILFSQLNIKHNTFLVKRNSFEKIGMFDESYHIVADAKWIRKAYLSKLKFTKINESLLFYSSMGASSAQSSSLREKIINESGSLIGEFFPFLDDRERNAIYISNFNTNSLEIVRRIFIKYRNNDNILINALICFIKFNLSNKNIYKASHHRVFEFIGLIDLCDTMNIPLSEIRIVDDDEFNLAPTFRAIDHVSAALKDDTDACVLHFCRKFSSPSEPFILNFVRTISERQPRNKHVVLCDERLLEDIRPYELVLPLPYHLISKKLSEKLYDLIWDRLTPKLIVTHFALNGFWLFQRLRREQRDIPTIIICHGIDVFGIQPDTDYERYIAEYAAIAPRVCFAPVSDYLASCLRAHGIPDDRIFKIPNTISDNFFQHRKDSGFYDGTRTLRVLSVGRLIAWKNHDALIRALAQVRNRIPGGCHLTIVYGGWDERLAELEALAGSLGVSDDIEFVPFVDFTEQVDFHAQFDLFVLPSTLSDDVPPRTETFGVAVLEAIASGLPVIASTAGGLPETIGATHPQARLFTHGNEVELQQVLIDMIAAPDEVFCDNRAYAAGRIAEFSADNQYERWSAAEAYVMRDLPKVYHVCALTRGGAAGSSLNVHKALCRQGYDSVFVTRDNEILSPFIPNAITLKSELSFDYAQAQVREKIRPRHTIFSIDDYSISNETLLRIFADAELINFTWFAQFISVENIKALALAGKSITITLRDMNPITGGCHYFHGCTKWQSDCHDCPQLIENDDNFPHLVLRNKLESWPDENITFIVLSDHSRAILQDSSVAKGKRIEKISNFVDGDFFFCEQRLPYREKLGFEDDEFVIGYLPSFNSIVKGHDYVLPILRRLAQLRPDLKFSLALAADSFPEAFDLPCALHKLGAIDGIGNLRHYYNAVDAVIVPSLEETFSNTTVEALACGAPVVGFKTGILEEVLRDERLGCAVAVGDVEGLAQGLARISNGDADRSLRSEIVLSDFSKERQTNLYDRLFRSLISERREAAESAPVSAERLVELSLLREQLDTARAVRKATGAAQRLSGLRRQSNGEIQYASGNSVKSAMNCLMLLPSKPVEMIGDLRRPEGINHDVAGQIAFYASHSGHIVFGPYYRLGEGRYRVVYRLRADFRSRLLMMAGSFCLVTECCLGPDNIVAQGNVMTSIFGGGRIEGALEFDVDSNSIERDREFEFRLHSEGKIEAIIESVIIIKLH